MKLLYTVVSVDLHNIFLALTNIPIPLAILVLVTLTCSDQDKVESIVTPKNFTIDSVDNFITFGYINMCQKIPSFSMAYNAFYLINI